MSIDNYNIEDYLPALTPGRKVLIGFTGGLKSTLLAILAVNHYGANNVRLGHFQTLAEVDEKRAVENTMFRNNLASKLKLPAPVAVSFSSFVGDRANPITPYVVQIINSIDPSIEHVLFGCDKNTLGYALQLGTAAFAVENRDKTVNPIDVATMINITRNPFETLDYSDVVKLYLKHNIQPVVYMTHTDTTRAITLRKEAILAAGIIDDTPYNTPA